MAFKIKKLVPIDTDSEGKQELSIPSVSPVSVYFEYNVNELPLIKLTLSVTGSKLYDYKHYKCIITFEDNGSETNSEEFDFFVEHIDERSSSNTVLTGLMCNYEQATVYKSVSLGDDLTEAVSQLGFSRKIISFDKPNIKFNYFQFNETANDALLKLLIGNSPYSYGYITDKAIGTINFSQMQKLDESTFISYDLGSEGNTIYVGNPYNVDSKLNETEIEFKSAFNKDKFDLYQSSINGDSIIYDDNCPQELNAMQNRRFMGTLNKSFTLNLNNAIQGRPNIGDIILFKGFDYFNTSNKGFPAIITKHVIYHNQGTSSYIYRVERI